MKKKLILIFLLATFTVQHIAVALSSWTSKPRQGISKLSKATCVWLSKKENRIIFAKAVGVCAGILVVGGCAFYLYRRHCAQSTRMHDGSQKNCPAGILFHRVNENGEVEILLGKNCNNNWQDFGGLADPDDKDAKFTAAREAAEETALVLDDVSGIDFQKGFQVENTKTFKQFSAAINNGNCFCVQSETSPPYHLYVVSGANSNLSNETPAKHSDNKKVLQSKKASYSYLEVEPIKWLLAKPVLDAINATKTKSHPQATIKGEMFSIRGATVVTLRPALEKLLKDNNGG